MKIHYGEADLIHRIYRTYDEVGSVRRVVDHFLPIRNTHTEANPSVHRVRRKGDVMFAGNTADWSGFISKAKLSPDEITITLNIDLPAHHLHLAGSQIDLCVRRSPVRCARAVAGTKPA